MKKLMVLLTLAAVSLGTGCIHYIRGDLYYINEKLDQNKEPKKIAHRVNVNLYAKKTSAKTYTLAGYYLNDLSSPVKDYNPYDINNNLKAGFTSIEVPQGEVSRYYPIHAGYEERKMLGALIGDLLSKNVLYTDKALGRKSENLFFDVSVMFHEVSDAVDVMIAGMVGGFTFWLWPLRTHRWNIYYAVDIYDKSQISTPEGANIALGDNRTIKPIARYEYQHVISCRYTILATLLIIPHVVGGGNRALTRAITDMTKEFMCDLKDGRKSIVSHNHWRGARGLTLSKEQVGDDKAEEARAAANMMATGMQAASGALNTYASMQRGMRPGMGSTAQFMANTSALVRTTKDLGLVAKSASDYRTQKKILANKNDNIEERLFATEGNAFPNKGGVKLWWYTYRTSTTGDQQFLAYFTGIDLAMSNLTMMAGSPRAYTITSKFESTTFGSPSAAIWFIRNKAKQIGDKRYMDIKL
ncbi:MAG TPA: hypothetical protein PKM65_08905 [Spirochaetota bacterium]|nr:hypothetical protein [Spirochaetota bacterium]HNT12451.1 hypothetical protein [Spirochaetota bacterium]